LRNTLYNFLRETDENSAIDAQKCPVESEFLTQR